LPGDAQRKGRESPPSAAVLYAEFVRRRREGEAVDIDAFCRQHPESAAELRELHDGWFEVAERALRMKDGLADRLEELLGSHEPESSDAEEQEVPDEIRALLERLGGRGSGVERYSVGDEVGSGGMGVVFEVLDVDLDRRIAMKVLDPKTTRRSVHSSAPQSVSRFLDEARITAQLDHPNIVPVHELGIDAQARLYYTMRLVRGRTLHQVFEQVWKGEEGWTTTRALAIVLKVCEALSYAHAKGVVHRDVKPNNVLVGRFGEVYLVDWGLARVLDREDPRDLRIRADQTVDLRSTRHSSDSDSGSPLLTMDGAVIGTPSYMPPEQARGDLAEIGPRSDVYAVGAMLYHLLSGRLPYVPKGARLHHMAIWHAVCEGPPIPIETVAPDQPAALQAICRKAMSRQPRDRYRDVGELTEDLRAYLEHRVVRAYRTGLAATLRSWVQRNRALAATVAVALVVLLASTAGFVWRLGREVKARGETLIELRDANHGRALLSVGPRVRETLERADDLWPAAPATAPAMEAWIGAARALAADSRSVLSEAELAQAGLVPLLASFDAEIARVEERLGRARSLRARSIDEHAEAWREALAAIADEPRYRGPDGSPLVLEPQLGLVPLGANPYTGLWEFWVAESGERPPARDPLTGGWWIEPETGIVLVLLPGDPDYALDAEHDGITSSWCRVPVDLHPFFLGAHEVSQGQWERVMPENPSLYRSLVTFGFEEETFDDRSPVDSVTWIQADEFARRLGLELASEAQWEYGCRAGTETDYWFGEDPRMATWLENLESKPFTIHSPVGHFAANPFGLYDTVGNVAEWCRDRFWLDYEGPRTTGDGMPPPPGIDEQSSGRRPTKVVRGGSWYTDEFAAGWRMGRRPESFSEDQGLRVARALDQCPRCATR
jgi:serine/threonine protein kinase